MVVPQPAQELILQTQRLGGNWHPERQHQAQQQTLRRTAGRDRTRLHQHRKGRDIRSVPCGIELEHLWVQTKKIRFLRLARADKMRGPEDQDPFVLIEQEPLLLLEVHQQVHLPLQVRQLLPSAQDSHHLQHPSSGRYLQHRLRTHLQKPPLPQLLSQVRQRRTVKERIPEVIGNRRWLVDQEGREEPIWNSDYPILLLPSPQPLQRS